MSLRSESEHKRGRRIASLTYGQHNKACSEWLTGMIVEFILSTLGLDKNV